MNKKGVIWISAVIYIALGIVAITLILAAGLPLINSLKDKNTYSQTKDILIHIDQNIEEINTEGPGSRRFIDTIVIKGGKLDMIIEEQEKLKTIRWTMTTPAVIVELSDKKSCSQDLTDEGCIAFKEGPLTIYQEETIVNEEYLIVIELHYDKIKVEFDAMSTQGPTDIQGQLSLLMENKGYQNNLVDTRIKVG